MMSTRLEGAMAALNSVELDAKAMVDRLPMTREVFHRLEAELERLADSLPAVPTLVLEHEMGEDAFIAAVPAAWEHRRGAQRLETLRRVLAQARVVDPNGSVLIGSRVVIRDDDGSLDTYTLA
jgi:transcription elongation GreA/GreB family factor